MATFQRTESTDVRREERASYDRNLAYAILDEGLVAHVGFVVDGQPFVIPMAYGRDGDRLLLHASVATRLSRALAGGAPVCVTITLLDGLVVARSQFNHSMNYRSVVVVDDARRVTDPEQAAADLVRIVDHILPGRSGESRPGNRVELRQTAVLEIPLVTSSVKTRTGPPIDDPDDLDSMQWAGVVPLRLTPGAPEPDEHTDPAAPLPPSVAGFTLR